MSPSATTSTTPFRLPAESGYRVEVMQLPVTADPRYLFVWQYDTSVEFTNGKLHLVQQVQLVNGGDAIIRLPQEGLRFDLPEGAESFQSQAMMSDQRILPDDEGFLLQGSLPPGGQTLLYGFDLPITPGTMRFATLQGALGREALGRLPALAGVDVGQAVQLGQQAVGQAFGVVLKVGTHRRGTCWAGTTSNPLSCA